MGDVLRFLHLVTALWFSAGVGLQMVVLAQGARAKDLTVVAFSFGLAQRAQKVFIIPALLVLGLTGGLTMIALGVSGRKVWIMLSVALTLLLLLVDVLYLQPHLAEAEKTAREAVARGKLTPRLSMCVQDRRRGAVSHGMALVLVVIVALMAFQPF
ncbi:MAG: DUF2269 family protein [Dehalococcoidia bacterium]|nr:DUF2269 family protein [Dehalococcoidia bacterium]